MADMIKGFSVNGEEYKVDYNSLGNKPFGVDTFVEVFPSKDIETSGDPAASDPFPIEFSSIPKNGDVCVVTFDGVEYEVTATYSYQDGGIFLGEFDDHGVFIFDNYPFGIGFYDYPDGYIFGVATSTAGVFNISVKKKDKTRIPLAYMPNELDVRNSYETVVSADGLQFQNMGDSYHAQLSESQIYFETGVKYRVTIGDYSVELYCGYYGTTLGGNEYPFYVTGGYGTFIDVNVDFYEEYTPTSVVIERIVPNPIQTAKNTMVYAFNGGDSWGQYVNLIDALNYIIQYGNDIVFYENKEQCDAANS